MTKANHMFYHQCEQPRRKWSTASWTRSMPVCILHDIIRRKTYELLESRVFQASPKQLPSSRTAKTLLLSKKTGSPSHSRSPALEPSESQPHSSRDSIRMARASTSQLPAGPTTRLSSVTLVSRSSSTNTTTKTLSALTSTVWSPI
jgi:hypothetical protein